MFFDNFAPYCWDIFAAFDFSDKAASLKIKKYYYLTIAPYKMILFFNRDNVIYTVF